MSNVKHREEFHRADPSMRLLPTAGGDNCFYARRLTRGGFAYSIWWDMEADPPKKSEHEIAILVEDGLPDKMLYAIPPIEEVVRCLRAR